MKKGNIATQTMREDCHGTSVIPAIWYESPGLVVTKLQQQHKRGLAEVHQRSDNPTKLLIAFDRQASLPHVHMKNHQNPGKKKKPKNDTPFHMTTQGKRVQTKPAERRHTKRENDLRDSIAPLSCWCTGWTAEAPPQRGQSPGAHHNAQKKTPAGPTCLGDHKTNVKGARFNSRPHTASNRDIHTTLLWK